MDSEQVRAACPSCVRLLSCDSVEEAENLMDSHNENMHDGDEVGFVMHETVEEMAEFLERVHELCTEERYSNFVSQLRNGNSEVFLVSAEFDEVTECVDHDVRPYKY
jgi:hypothetical protein